MASLGATLRGVERGVLALGAPDEAMKCVPMSNGGVSAVCVFTGTVRAQINPEREERLQMSRNICVS